MKTPLLLILLSGCVAPTQFDPATIDGKRYTFVFHMVEAIKPNYKGLHLYDKETNIHHIWLIESELPGCLAHETLHALFGDWHKGRDSMEFCHNKRSKL